MIAYLICFTVTLFCTSIAQKCLDKKKKCMWIVFSILSISIPSFFAGVRAMGVGRDMTMYVSNFWELSNKYNLGRYIEICNTTSVEIGYCMFVYIISTLFKNIHVLLFFIQLIPCFSVYYFAYKNKEKVKMWMVMLIYLLTMYLKSYTIMRQCIAVGIILISIVKFNEKKYIKSILLFLMAYFFHNSAIVAIFMYAIIYMNNSKNITDKQKNVIYIISLGIMSIFMLEYDSLLYFFSFDIEILPKKFYNYLSSDYFSNNIEVVKTDAILKIIYFTFSMILLMKKDRNKNDIPYVIFIVVDIIIFLISFKMTNISRIGYYFFYPAILYLTPRFTNIFKNNPVNKRGIYAIFFMVLLSYWIYTYPIKEDCETYPYKSDIIQIFNFM